MSPKTYQAFTLALALALGRAAIAQPGLIAELAAGPLLGIEHPLKGCSGGLLLGAAYGPFEAGLRASAAYDAGFDAALIFLDLELGLGSGLRAIVGGLLPLGELALADPSGGGTSVPVEEGPWPNRFGLASTLLDLPWRH